MLITSLIVLPFVLGLLAYLMPWRRLRRVLLVTGSVVHALQTWSLLESHPEPVPGDWFGADALGLVFLCIVSVLFLAVEVFAVGYLHAEATARHVDKEEGFLFRNEREAVFIACLFCFLGSMTLVTLSQHLGLLWIGIEATTLASAPLIYFHRHHRSLEATWKYILICSVGVALALLGNFVLSVAARGAVDGENGMVLANLLGGAGSLEPVWLSAAFLFFLVGYGTKMGLVPLHSWLPDAHSEAPSLVSALLSGCLLNCAFLGILRPHQVLVAAGVGDFSGSLLVVFGIVSMAGATIFIIGQTDFKRMLAYSSVEHMGILALGVGLGGAGVFGAFFHAFNHSLKQAALFLAAGNILAVYRTNSIRQVSGVLGVLPITGVLWLAGFFAITGTPPFGTFASEFQILKAALDDGRFFVGTLYIVFLSLIFIGMANAFLRMAQGAKPPEVGVGPRPHPVLSNAPPALLLIGVLFLGFHIPAWTTQLLKSASSSVLQTPTERAAQRVPARPLGPNGSGPVAPLPKAPLPKKEEKKK